MSFLYHTHINYILDLDIEMQNALWEEVYRLHGNPHVVLLTKL